MSFFLPNFNLTAAVWHPPNVPPAAADFLTIAQLYTPPKGILDITPGDDTAWVPPVYLRVPLGTDIRVNDVVECAVGDGWIYRIRWIERMHRGFPNEYFIGILEQTSTGPPTPPFGGFMELESGDTVLTESGGFVLIE